LIGFIFGVFGGVDLLIERKLSNPTILRRIAAESRPVLLFEVSTNGSASVLKDAGALRFVKDHSIEVVAHEGAWPTRIRIDFTESLDFAPALSAVYGTIITDAKRDGGCAWVFDIHPGFGSSEGLPRVFRMEIVW
jgi:hypothetical protein